MLRMTGVIQSKCQEFKVNLQVFHADEDVSNI